MVILIFKMGIIPTLLQIFQHIHYFNILTNLSGTNGLNKIKVNFCNNNNSKSLYSSIPTCLPSLTDIILTKTHGGSIIIPHYTGEKNEAWRVLIICPK